MEISHHYIFRSTSKSFFFKEHSKNCSYFWLQSSDQSSQLSGQVFGSVLDDRADLGDVLGLCDLGELGAQGGEPIGGLLGQDIQSPGGGSVADEPGSQRHLALEGLKLKISIICGSSSIERWLSETPGIGRVNIVI